MGAQDGNGGSSRGPTRGRRAPATPAQPAEVAERLSEEEARLLASAEQAVEGGRALGRSEALVLARQQVARRQAWNFHWAADDTAPGVPGSNGLATYLTLVGAHHHADELFVPFSEFAKRAQEEACFAGKLRAPTAVLSYSPEAVRARRERFERQQAERAADHLKFQQDFERQRKLW